MKMAWRLCFLLMVFLVSCKREVLPPDAASIGKDYFPLKEGHFIEYEVDSLIYNTFTKDTDLVHIEFRDEIAGTFADNLGRTSYAIERSVRPDSNSTWTGQMSYYATQADFEIEVVENNLRFIKLVFPVKANTVWKGNIYIPASTSGLDELKWYYDWDYTYGHINEDFDNGLLNFPNSVVIEYEQLTNDSTSNTQYSNYTHYKESYSRNVGLIYRELTHWEYQPTDNFRNGFSVVMRAKKYNE
ncbi:hypothetical protein EMGBS15_15830 [Filimonas sp.]|nr:hypothetical protein EMGBS15_15830 [Filimonas sp.]